MAVGKAFGPVDMSSNQVLSGDILEYNSSRIVISDGVHTAVYLGNNFTYNQFGLTGGTLTGFEAYVYNVLNLRVTNMSVPAVTAANLINSGNLQKLYSIALAKNDTLTGSAFGDVLLGFNGNDTISGGGGSDGLAGMNGNDLLKGGGSIDLLIGGQGDDILIGGNSRDLLEGNGGSDSFVFNSTAESAAGTNRRDTIADFQHGLDRIDLSGIDAKAATAPNDSFTFIKGAAFSAAGQVRAYQSGADTIVEVNTVGKSGAEMQIVLADFKANSLTSGDFIL